jgi:hypothetical protein
MKHSPYFEELLRKQKDMKKVFLNSVCCKCVCVDDLKWRDEIGDVMCDKCYENMKKDKR